jgi:hypothetical protein
MSLALHQLENKAVNQGAIRYSASSTTASTPAAYRGSPIETVAAPTPSRARPTRSSRMIRKTRLVRIRWCTSKTAAAVRSARSRSAVLSSCRTRPVGSTPSGPTPTRRSAAPCAEHDDGHAMACPSSNPSSNPTWLGGGHERASGHRRVAAALRRRAAGRCWDGSFAAPSARDRDRTGVLPQPEDRGEARSMNTWVGQDDPIWTRVRGVLRCGVPGVLAGVGQSTRSLAHTIS